MNKMATPNFIITADAVAERLGDHYPGLMDYTLSHRKAMTSLIEKYWGFKHAQGTEGFKNLCELDFISERNAFAADYNRRVSADIAIIRGGQIWDTFHSILDSETMKANTAFLNFLATQPKAEVPPPNVEQWNVIFDFVRGYMYQWNRQMNGMPDHLDATKLDEYIKDTINKLVDCHAKKIRLGAASMSDLQVIVIEKAKKLADHLAATEYQVPL